MHDPPAEPSVEPPDEREGHFAPRTFFWMGLVLGALGVVITALAVNIFTIDEDHVTWPRGATGGEALAAASGAVLVEQQGCVACHTADGSPSTGPTWLGLAGTERMLVNGATVVADATYLRQSIVEPRAAVVDGFAAAIMPGNYGDTLSTSELEAVVSYLESLAETSE